VSVLAVLQQTVYASAARTATPTAVEVPTQGRQRLHLVIVATAAAATPSVVPTIDAYDAASATWYNLLTGNAITATGTTTLKIGPGFPGSANAVSADMLPGLIRITMTHADADSLTYSVGLHLAP
jgi:hypothetical protein